MEWIDVRLHPELADATRQMARNRDISVGQLVRDLLDKEIRRETFARPPIRADERLVAPLRARLANDLAHADGWEDLARRLRSKGYALQPAGGGLALYTIRDGLRICKASELGFSYSKLMRRFQAPYPAHNHTWLAKRMLDQAESEEDFDVIEPF